MKRPNDQSTIVAPATPPGRGGIGVVRISGSLVPTIAEKILGSLPKPRYAAFHAFLDEAGQVIDEGLALFFPGPKSFTGEDVLELHGHGGPTVMDSLVRRIVALGAKIAKPGEFSERAFLNGKIDLTQAEAIADLIDATSEQAARASLRSLQGEFSKKIRELVEGLIQLRMYVEAAIDFVEEEIDFLSQKEVTQQLTALIYQLGNILAVATQGSLLREGIHIVITGAPNVGKSSLLNCLSGKDSAIVTDIPGTTRDVLREQILLDGLPLHFIDTAGLRESADLVEQEGIRRARNEMTQADIILYVIDARDNVKQQNDFPAQIPVVMVRNKIDLTQESPAITEHDEKTIISLSVKENNGIDLLKNHIKKCAGFQQQCEGTFSARSRHITALQRAREFLLNGEQQLKNFRAGELLAEDLRQAQQVLSEITGEFTTDQLLGRIFSSFCVGK